MRGTRKEAWLVYRVVVNYGVAIVFRWILL